MNLLSDDCIDEKCSSGFIMPISKDIIVSSNKKSYIRNKSELSYLCVPIN